MRFLRRIESKKIEDYIRNLVEENSVSEADKYKTQNIRRSPEYYDIIGGFRNMSEQGLLGVATDK